MTIHTIPHLDATTERRELARSMSKLEELAKSHPSLRDASVREAIQSLLDSTPKTGDDIIDILESAPGKKALILRLLEDPEIIEALSIRETVLAKIEVIASSKNPDREIIERDVPQEFLCTLENQKERAQAYGLWKGLEEYVNIAERGDRPSYLVHVAYTAYFLHRFGISLSQIQEDTTMVIHGKKYRLEHDSFLAMAKHCCDLTREHIKNHRVRTNSDINSMLKMIELAWNDEQKGIVERDGNIVCVDFRR